MSCDMHEPEAHELHRISTPGHRKNLWKLKLSNIINLTNLLAKLAIERLRGSLGLDVGQAASVESEVATERLRSSKVA